MPTEWTPLDTAEAILLGVGAIVVIVFLARAARPEVRRGLLDLPAPAASRVELLDVFLALTAIWLAPPLWHAALSPLFPAAGESITATQEAIEPATTQTNPSHAAPEKVAGPHEIIAVALGQLTAVTVLLLIGRARFTGGLTGWGLTTKQLGTRLWQALLAYVGIWPVCYLLVLATYWVLRQTAPSYEPVEHTTILTLLSDHTSSLSRILMTLSAVVLAPLGEELFFRGLFLPFIAQGWRNSWTAIAITAVLFGAFHYPLFHVVPALAALGFLLGYLYVRTGSLTLVVLVHAVFNAKTLLWLALGARVEM